MAHANIDGVGSMAGRIVLLVDESGRCCPLSWKSNKIRRVVKSTLAADTLSMQEGLEDSIYLRSMVGELEGKEAVSIPIVLYIDKKSVREAILSTKMVDDKMLRLDIAAVKENVKGDQNIKMEWCPGKQQLANCLTKRGTTSYHLMQVLQSGQLIR